MTWPLANHNYNLPHVCNAFEQALYVAGAAGWIWDGYTMDLVSGTDWESVEHNAKDSLGISTNGNSTNIDPERVLKAGNSCAGATCIRSNSGASSSVIQFSNGGDVAYPELGGSIRAGSLFNTIDYVVESPTLLGIDIGSLRNGSASSTKGIDIRWGPTGLTIQPQHIGNDEFFSFATYAPGLVQPGPMWVDVEYNYYSGAFDTGGGEALYIHLTIYINGLEFLNKRFTVGGDNFSTNKWTPAAGMIIWYASGSVDELYLSNLYHNTDTLASWVADGRISDLKAAYSRNFS